MCQSLHNIRNTKITSILFCEFSPKSHWDGYLNAPLDGADVGALVAAAVQVPGDRRPSVNLQKGHAYARVTPKKAHGF